MNKIFPVRALNTSLLSALVIAGLVMTAPVAAADLEGYANDSSNSIVRTGFGECLRTGSWSKDMANAECDPNLVAKAPEPVEVVAAAPEPKRTVQRINLASDAYFGFDKAVLTDEGKMKLDELAASMAGKEDPRIQITGYTDRLGSESYNMTLSQKRAEAVKAYLIGKGIQTDIMETAAMGPKDPVVTCEGLRGSALIQCLGPNRRTVIEFSAFEVIETR